MSENANACQAHTTRQRPTLLLKRQFLASFRPIFKVKTGHATQTGQNYRVSVTRTLLDGSWQRNTGRPNKNEAYILYVNVTFV